MFYYNDEGKLRGKEYLGYLPPFAVKQNFINIMKYIFDRQSLMKCSVLVMINLHKVYFREPFRAVDEVFHNVLSDMVVYSSNNWKYIKTNTKSARNSPVNVTLKAPHVVTNNNMIPRVPINQDLEYIY